MNSRAAAVSAALVSLALALAASALSQQPTPAAAPPATQPDKLLPGLDLSSIDLAADPCKDFYQYACGKFDANHPIPPDQADADAFYVLYNVNTARLNGILQKAETGGAPRTPDEQKIGDYFHACMDTAAIDARGLKPIQPLLARIAELKNTPASRASLAALIGDLQRIGVGIFFGYGEQQDFKDATKQIAFIQQGGLGLPEKDYYLRTGEKDVEMRHQYTAHIAKMLTLAGEPTAQAQREADAILALETSLAKVSLGVVDMREPEKTYHLVPVATVQSALPHFNFTTYEDALHSPRVTEINNGTPDFLPELARQLQSADIPTIQAYLRYHLLTSVARNLPHAFDDENFNFYSHTLNGTQQQRPRWKRCSASVDAALGEDLGKLYVQQYFAGDSKQKMLQMVHDIEAAMGRDIDQIDWMSPATKARAHEKLAAVADKIGYPDKWRDYSKLAIRRGDALGNQLRADAFENDRELSKIGKPVDRGEWEMSPPTVNAYFDPSMNDINFPAGILQPPFYDTTQDAAVNYGHIGAVIGHELTHGFDDEGRKFDAKGNLDNWWTPDDLKNFTQRTDCLVKEYSGFNAGAASNPSDDIKVNGALTLGENTADNGGALLAFMAYMERAQQQHLDPAAKTDGFTAAQRFYIAYAQNWCANTRPQQVRSQVLTDPHAPDRIRVDGVIVNQPGFAGAFGCKAGTPSVPASSCRVW